MLTFAAAAPKAGRRRVMNDTSYRHILKYTGLLGSVQLLGVAVAVVRNKVTAVLIGSPGMGLADFYARAVELLSGAAGMGLGLSGTRGLSALSAEGRQRRVRHYVCLLRSLSLWAALFGAALTVALAPLLSRLTTGHCGLTAGYALLAPSVAATVVMAGETAVLKGMRRLRSLAAATAAYGVMTLLVTVPLYWWLGLRGVLPVVTAITVGSLIITLCASTRACPYRVAPLRRGFLRRGAPLLRLGAAYVAATVMNTGAEMAVRGVLVRTDGGLATVGLYAAGLTLAVSYVRIVFTAMDADFFPRLSAVVRRRGEMNLTVNRQVDVLVVLVAPFLIVFALALPWVVRLIYTEEFMAVVPMVLCALVFMYFKALFTPVGYLALAAGDALLFMGMELAYDLFFLLLVAGGAMWGGLVGAGAGLALSGLLNLLLLFGVYARRYGFRPDRAVLVRAGYLLICLAGGLLAATSDVPAWRYGPGALCALLASLPAIRLLRRR